MLDNIDKDSENKDDLRDIKNLNVYRNEISGYKILSKEDEANLARRIHNGDMAARDELVKANLRFVEKVAQKYKNLGLPLADLIQEGSIGLYEAAEKFDETQGFKFITYAYWWIREAILKALAETGRTIRVPKNQVELTGKINKTIKDFENEHCRKPTDDEIADILDVVDRDVSLARASSQKNISLDATFSEDDDRTVLDTNILESEASDSTVMDESDKSELKDILSVIPPEEQYVVGHFLGFGYDKMTATEIADTLRKTKKRVYQIKDNGIRHLLKRTKSKSLKKILLNLKDS